jgi:hypothetical protein
MSDPVMVEYERRTAISNGYQAMPMPDEQQIKDGAHILSEILDDAAPLNESRYRFPARQMLRYAAWLRKNEDAYDRGRRDMLNAILTLNPEVARKLHDIRGEEPAFTNEHGKLPFDVVFWVTAVAEQLGIEPKEDADAAA